MGSERRMAYSFWLVDALQMAGEEIQAMELLERLPALRNDVGLLSEEWDPSAGRQLGNTPQAFSHFPLVTSALKLQAGAPEHSDQPLRHGPELKSVTPAIVGQGLLEAPGAVSRSLASSCLTSRTRAELTVSSGLRPGAEGLHGDASLKLSDRGLVEAIT